MNQKIGLSCPTCGQPARIAILTPIEGGFLVDVCDEKKETYWNRKATVHNETRLCIKRYLAKLRPGTDATWILTKAPRAKKPKPIQLPTKEERDPDASRFVA